LAAAPPCPSGEKYHGGKERLDDKNAQGRVGLRGRLSRSAHVPEKACPALDAGWIPVLR